MEKISKDAEQGYKHKYNTISNSSLPRLIALVGPSCAGKNTAGKILENLGFAVVDADIVAHKVLKEKQNEVIDLFKEVAQEQNIELACPDGSLNRTALASLVFPNPHLLAQHEALLYPRITELLEEFILSHKDVPVVLNAVHIHKTPLIYNCDFVIYIDACYFVRLFRAFKRDKLSIFQIFERFSAQKQLFSQYLEKNVDILRVDNSKSIKALEKKLLSIFAIT